MVGPDCEGLELDFPGAMGSHGRFVSREVTQAGSCVVQRLRQEEQRGGCCTADQARWFNLSPRSIPLYYSLSLSLCPLWYPRPVHFLPVPVTLPSVVPPARTLPPCPFSHGLRRDSITNVRSTSFSSLSRLTWASGRWAQSFCLHISKTGGGVDNSPS